MDNRAASPLAPLPPPPGTQPSIEQPLIGIDSAEVRSSGDNRVPRLRARAGTDHPIASPRFVSVSGEDATATSSRNRTFTEGAGTHHIERPFSSDGGGVFISVQGGQAYTEGGGSVASVQGGERNRAFTEGGGTVVSVQPRQGSHAYAAPAENVRFADGKGKAEATPMQGLYIAKTAVGIMATYLGIQLLITFEEVLLPFIFAILIMVILEPLKKFVMTVTYRVVVYISKKFNLKVCTETKVQTESGVSPTHTVRVGRTDSVAVSEGGHLYGNVDTSSPDGEDSNEGEDGPRQPGGEVTQPIPTVQKLILLFSIIFCVAVAGRVLWLTAKVFIKAGAIISANLEFYRKGTIRCKFWIEDYVRSLNMKGVNWAHVLDDLVEYLEAMASFLTKSIMYTLLQAMVSLIFLLYMLWSPIKMDSNSTSQEVFISTGRYLKVKCSISAFTGCCVCISLWAVGLDMPAAFGFLAFLCNFLPGIGSVIASVAPCVLAMIDVRKTPAQVFIALLSQFGVHFFIDFVVEPVFFGISVEIHSVIVILGIWFFFKVWGVAGMLLSVPLLAVMRLLLKSLNSAQGPGRESETLVFLDSILEGRWMSSVGEDSTFLDVELPEMSIHGTGSQDPSKFSTGEAGEGLGDATVRTSGIWGALESSPVGKEVSRIYYSNRLLFDISALVGLVVGLTAIPL